MTTYVGYTEAILSPGGLVVDLTGLEAVVDTQISQPGEPDVVSPPEPSPNGTILPPATAIVDLNNDTWTIGDDSRLKRNNISLIHFDIGNRPARQLAFDKIAMSEQQIYARSVNATFNMHWFRYAGISTPTGYTKFVNTGLTNPPGVVVDPPPPPPDPIPGVIAGFSPALKTARDVVLVGNYVYVAADVFGLVIVNISTPSTPIIVASSPLPFDGARILVSGTKAYVTGYRRYYSPEGALLLVNAFYIIDITTPTAPVVLGSLEGGAVAYFGMALSGNNLFVACGVDGVKVIDVSTPATPTVIGSGYNTPGGSTSIAISGTNAYVADGTGGLRVLDITTPTAPTEIGSNTTPGNAKDIAISGSVAYIADSSSLQVIDITNPASPSDIGSYTMSAFAVVIQGTSAFISTTGGGLVILDITTPGSPTLLGSLLPTGGPSATTLRTSVGTGVAVCANATAGLGVVNISNLSSPVFYATLAEWFTGYKLAIKTGLAVVSGTRVWNGGYNNSYGIKLYNITSPGAPVLLGSFLTSAYAFYGVEFYGTYVYAACGSAGLKIFDISDTANPVLAGSYTGIGNASAVAVKDNFLYVTCGTLGLKVLDITNPIAPVIEGSLDTPNHAKAISISGDVAYVSDSTSVQIIDINNPGNPILLSAYASSAAEAEADNNILCIATTITGLKTVDVSNTASPVTLGSKLPIGFLNPTSVAVAVSGTRAFMANGGGGIEIVDISIPTTPALMVPVLMLGGSFGIKHSTGWLFATDDLATLVTVAIEEE